MGRCGSTREWLVPVGQRRARKLCPACEQVKDVEQFHRNRAAHDGRSAYCAVCEGKRHKPRAVTA